MERLSKILGPALAKKGLLRQATGAQICFYAESWKKVPFSVISFSNGILKVSITSSSAASELQMLSEDLIDFLNRKIGKKQVRSIRIINRN